jgi:acyl-coenzyme A synthetase/AMP-(fatty) acid ligase
MPAVSPLCTPAPLSEVTRGNVVESVHFGAVAVVDRDGRVLRATGDPFTLTFARSALKPVQAHAGIAEVAVVGIHDELKGQVPIAFCVVKDPSRVADTSASETMRREVMQTVDHELGAIARPSTVYFVSLLPKTRSGKLLRRSIQALAEARDPGDLTTIEDPSALDQIRLALM